MRWVQLGLFQSIWPTIKYQRLKANIVANALSQSKRGTSNANAEDRGLQLTTNEEEDVILALMGITITMQPIEIREWK